MQRCVIMASRPMATLALAEPRRQSGLRPSATVNTGACQNILGNCSGALWCAGGWQLGWHSLGRHRRGGGGRREDVVVRGRGPAAARRPAQVVPNPALAPLLRRRRAVSVDAPVVRPHGLDPLEWNASTWCPVRATPPAGGGRTGAGLPNWSTPSRVRPSRGRQSHADAPGIFCM